MTATILPRQLAEIHATGKSVRLIDVRTPAEFGEIHVPFARNVPLDRLSPQSLAAAVAGLPDGPLYVICRSGSRGNQACEKLAATGRDAVNVEGGTLAWEAAALDVVRGRKAISLERQVRIVAGTLAFAGAALGYFVHPAWIGLSAFIGAGLIFAGVTDRCGMAVMLGRMPWNQRGDKAVACGTK